MKKNAFTLVELITVIAILAVITIIFIPNTAKILKENSTKVYKVKEKQLIESAKDYVEFDKDFVPPTDTDPVKYININTLISKNDIDKILENKTGNECSGVVKVSLNSIAGYDYDACIICSEYKTDKSFCTSEILASN